MRGFLREGGESGLRDAVGVVPYGHEPRKKIKHSVFSRKEDGE